MKCGYRKQQELLIKKLEKELRLQRDSTAALAVSIQNVDAYTSPLLNSVRCLLIFQSTVSRICDNKVSKDQEVCFKASNMHPPD